MCIICTVICLSGGNLVNDEGLFKQKESFSIYRAEERHALSNDEQTKRSLGLIQLGICYSLANKGSPHLTKQFKQSKLEKIIS